MQNPQADALDTLLPKPHPTNLIINYLPSDVTEQELNDLFCTFGSIRSVKIIRDTSGLCCGYGFVDFVNPRHANTAQVLLNGLQLRDKRLKVAFALPRGSDIGKCNLFVRYLPESVDEQELEKLFEVYGKIWSVKILRDKYNRITPQKSAYVRFVQPADAEKARITLHGFNFPGATQPISVMTAKSIKRDYSKDNGAQAMETTRRNPSPPPNNQVGDSKFGCGKNVGTNCVCELPWSPSPAPEVPIRPKGFVFPDLD